MKTLAQFHKDNPVVAEGVRVLNDITPKSSITYVAYRRWVIEKKPISAAYKVMLFLKGVKP